MDDKTIDEKKVFIDLKKVFNQKNPKLARYIPGFIYRYLDRALHIPEINDFVAANESKIGLEFTEAVIEDFNVSVSLKGESNLPETGRFIFVSNHPLGGFDGMILLTVLGKKYKDVRSLSNDILMNFESLRPLFIPVNKHGALTHESARILDSAMDSEIQILTFPSGLVSRKTNGKIIDPPWKKSFINKAVQHKRDIIPIHVTGRCTNFFYNLSNFRKFLGIKANIEMFYLADETYRHRNEHINITFGAPVSYKTFDKSKKPDEWALSMRNYVYSLAEGNIKPFDTHY
jgi:1-acyl-sn-glycerol-3-phosphate acyltransferase